jgi:hypothetical protein
LPGEQLRSRRPRDHPNPCRCSAHLS